MEAEILHQLTELNSIFKTLDPLPNSGSITGMVRLEASASRFKGETAAPAAYCYWSLMH